MKTLKLTSIILLISLLTACGGKKEETKTTTDTTPQTTIEKPTSRIEVVDFYATHRCDLCKAIEANARYAVESFFPKEVKSGKLSFISANVDEEKDQEITERFQAPGTALYLNIIKDGKETHIDLTELAFSKGLEKEAYAAELKTKIEEELAKL